MVGKETDLALPLRKPELSRRQKISIKTVDTLGFESELGR